MTEWNLTIFSVILWHETVFSLVPVKGLYHSVSEVAKYKILYKMLYVCYFRGRNFHRQKVSPEEKVAILMAKLSRTPFFPANFVTKPFATDEK